MPPTAVHRHTSRADRARASLAASIDEPSRFEEVFALHGDEIFRYAAMRVGTHLAEDVVAETFATAFARRGSFRPEQGNVRPWLYGIAAMHLMRWRDQERRWLEQCARGASVEAGDRVDADAVTTSAIALVDGAAVRPRIAAALEQLPSKERDVVLLHAVGGLSHSEVASALGIRKGTAKVRLSRASARLRALLHDLDPVAQEDAS